MLSDDSSPDATRPAGRAKSGLEVTLSIALYLQALGLFPEGEQFAIGPLAVRPTQGPLNLLAAHLDQGKILPFDDACNGTQQKLLKASI
jgi:hypothetical protein